MKMTKEQKKYFMKIANQHADFLTQEVFKPAFVMGFFHGAKHALDESRIYRVGVDTGLIRKATIIDE